MQTVKITGKSSISEAQIQTHLTDTFQGDHVEDLEGNPTIDSESSTYDFLVLAYARYLVIFRSPANLSFYLWVTWNGAENPENPKNWEYSWKWVAVIVLSSFAIISPISSTIVDPGLAIIASEFHIEADPATQLVLSACVIGFAFGPFLIGLLSEIYGRVPVLQIASFFYLIFNIACGASRNLIELIAFCILGGTGGSASLTVRGKP
jgi:multisubunit Na+/H+ antiporter MnhC subunit